MMSATGENVEDAAAERPDDGEEGGKKGVCGRGRGWTLGEKLALSVAGYEASLRGTTVGVGLQAQTQAAFTDQCKVVARCGRWVGAGLPSVEDVEKERLSVGGLYKEFGLGSAQRCRKSALFSRRQPLKDWPWANRRRTTLQQSRSCGMRSTMRTGTGGPTTGDMAERRVGAMAHVWPPG